MSWLFGIIGPHVRNGDLQRYRSVHDTQIHENIKEGSHYFASGGNIQTCFAGNTTFDDSFWMGLGIIIQNKDAGCKIFSSEEWAGIARNTEMLNSQNGHYIFLTYADNAFTIRTDTLGLRTIYWDQRENEIVVSTRIDWIAKYRGGLTIDYRNTGSRWLLFNQLSYRSLVKETNRLGPNGTLIIRNNRVTFSGNPFTPPQFSNSGSIEDGIECLQAFVLPSLHGQQISLGLSGGLDSRVLLSLILRSGRKDFQTHTFGNILDPDISIPKTIAEKERFANITYDTLLTDPRELYPILQSYAAETNLIEPISTALRLKNISSLDSRRFILMDGGFGEIARRQYLNKLALYGKRPFREHNIELILNNLRVRRGNFLSADIIRQMEEGVRAEISGMMQAMPAVDDIGLGNYLDLWSIRARFPNFGSDEQARLDKQILNYMPFAQLRFVNLVFSMPISLRKNGAFFRNIIRSRYAPLSQFPLVKGGTTYPFSFSTKAAWLYVKIKSMAGKRFNENHIDPFLVIMREYIFDLLLSKGVQENPAYNYPHIRSSIENYYRGDVTNKSELIWWLTFELWRRAIEQK